ncbi:RWD domain containing [Orbilia brochopaga]|uniref:RWD domain containing n=1 Tax=Orbilia brochopaga TaxID=3140254 RepID=A0AAV9VAC5_9PEZI
MIFTRVFFMFHHIRARRKRQLIQTLAEELRLRGVCKHGYPGFLYVEGEDPSVQAYIKEIKRMRWQSVEVRRKEQEAVDGTVSSLGKVRMMDGPFGVAEVDSSKAMSEMLRAAGLAEFLQKAMKGVGA